MNECQRGRIPLPVQRFTVASRLSGLSLSCSTCIHTTLKFFRVSRVLGKVLRVKIFRLLFVYKSSMGEIVPTISRIREQKGLTQRQLADAVGVTETTIANWEHGRSGSEWFVRIHRLCEILGVDPGDLYDDIPLDSVPDPSDSQTAV